MSDNYWCSEEDCVKRHAYVGTRYLIIDRYHPDVKLPKPGEANLSRMPKA